jgi:hypothetical protein
MAAGPLTPRRGLQPFQRELRRIYILRGSVNRGRRAGRSCLMFSLQQGYLAKIRGVVGIEQVPRGEGAGLVAPSLLWPLVLLTDRPS